MSEPSITVESLQLTEGEARAFAAMLKRMRWPDWREISVHHRAEGELMRAACAKVLRAFADAGIR